MNVTFCRTIEIKFAKTIIRYLQMALALAVSTVIFDYERNFEVDLCVSFSVDYNTRLSSLGEISRVK